MEQTLSTITKDQLLENGWVLTNDSIFPIKKTISIKEDDEDEENDEGDMDLVLHRMYNTDMFALSLPDGTLININPASIEQLNLFESLILSVDLPY